MPFEGITQHLTNLDLEIQPKSRSRELVIILHGWTSTPAVMKDVRAVIGGRPETGETASLPDADIIVPTFNRPGATRADGRLSFLGTIRSIFSNVSCYELAWDLVCLIEAALEERAKRDGGEYERVILIGHSIGALIVRKAVVFAHGQTQDAPIKPAPAAKPWAAKVKRVILFAAMNRGWRSDQRLSYMGRTTWYFLRTLDFLTQRLPIGKLIRGAKRGAPFVSDLRLQWLRLAQRDPSPLPATVQMRGTKDDVVTEEDSADLEAAGGFIYRTLNGGGHLSIVQLSPVKHLEHAAWRRAFLEVLTAGDVIPGDAILRPLQPDKSVERVVFIMHGIRDYGAWTTTVAGEVMRLSGGRAVPRTPSYDYFPMGRFLLFGGRQRNVRWFMDQYTEAAAIYPKALFSFIGHSNGTYLLGSALRRYKTPIFDRVVCAGSVLPRSFPWERFVAAGRVTAIQNYVATADWVVGFFPGFFQGVARLFGREPDIGSGGHNGFLDDVAHLYAIAFVRGGHGAAIIPNNMVNLARFAVGENVTQEMVPNFAGEADRSGMVDLFSKLSVLVWLLIVAVVLVVVLGPFLIGWSWATSWAIASVVLLWLVLMRI